MGQARRTTGVRFEAVTEPAVGVAVAAKDIDGTVRRGAIEDRLGQAPFQQPPLADDEVAAGRMPVGRHSGTRAPEVAASTSAA